MADAMWVENIKKIVLQAEAAGSPCDVIPGVVAGTAPIAVRIDQKTTVAGPQVLVPRHLTDYAAQMDIPGLGTVTVTVKNALKPGEQVLMIQKRGGQQYLVVDRW